jgi:CubicO group peptidase (beta-lactamase class C family)
MEKLKFTKYIDEAIQKEIDDARIAGAQIALYKLGDESGKINEFYRKCYGYADKENKKETKEDTIYRLFSMTKLITSVAVMILYERGKIDLLMPLSHYLPEFKDMMVLDENGERPAKSQITVQQVMNMTAGLVYPDMSFKAGMKMQEAYDNVLYANWKSGKEMNTEEVVKLIAKQPLEFEPGERWRYSTCADVAGRLVEVASGMKFSEFLKKEIFIPLGMTDTDFYVPKEKQDRFSVMYDYDWEKMQLKVAGYNFLGLGDYLNPPKFESGGAGLVTTVDDYAKFACMLANMGEYGTNGERILSSNTVDFMTTNALTDEQKKYFCWEQLKGYGYANFFRTLEDNVVGCTNATHDFGWDGYMGDYVSIDAVSGVVILYMQQKFGGCDNSLIRRIRNIVYGGIDEIEEIN